MEISSKVVRMDSPFMVFNALFRKVRIFSDLERRGGQKRIPPRASQQAAAAILT
jgi:hypothetical protein